MQTTASLGLYAVISYSVNQQVREIGIRVRRILWRTFALAGLGLALIAVAAAAGYFPDRRASRIDPMVALRAD